MYVCRNMSDELFLQVNVFDPGLNFSNFQKRFKQTIHSIFHRFKCFGSFG